MSLSLDHVIYAGRDLEPLMSSFANLTGVTPAKGGRHPGMGTMNALASLGADVYFELLAIDPSQTLSGNMGARVNALPFPRLFAYMLKSRELEMVRKAMLEHGISADLFDASRETPDGKTLRWRLLVPHDNPLGDFVPKCIDWLDSVHPATTSVPGCTFESFEMGHPQAQQLRSLLGALGANLSVERADRPYFKLRMRTPKGPLVLTG
ncbi:MAG: VOC family protein [Burkholderiales bacterium]|nr:VOC family protein [Burkholderiales bacterium]